MSNKIHDSNNLPSPEPAKLRRRSSIAIAFEPEKDFEQNVPTFFDATPENLQDLTQSQVKNNVQETLTFIQTSGNKIKNLADPFVEANFPNHESKEATAYYKAYISSLLVELKPLLKFAKFGAAARVLFIVFIQYQDMVTDVLVIDEYYTAQDYDSFYSSFGILVFATTLHLGVNIAKNAKKSFGVRIRGALAALCLLSPAIESYEYWRGSERTESDLFEAVVLLVFTRAIEMVCESVPESAVQLSVLMKTENPSFLMYFSICSSVLAAGAIMTETNVSFERGKMNAQMRGPGSHGLWGLLPDNSIDVSERGRACQLKANN